MEDFANLGFEALQIWRLEEPNPIKLRRVDFGKFYNEHSYVIIRNLDDASSVHLWEGEKCNKNYLSKAEYICKTMTANNLLYREFQGNESSLFMSYFSKMQYIDKQLSSEMPRMWQWSGKRIVRATQVKLSVDSLTNSSCFILDRGLIQYFWCGDKVSEYVKLRSLELVDNIRTLEHGSISQVCLLETADPKNESDFWKILGTDNPETISDEEESEEEQPEYNQNVSLYKIEDTGESEELDAPYKRKVLDSDSIFILQTDYFYYVWIGKEAMGAGLALQIAEAWVKEQELPHKITTIRIYEGQEDVIFKSYFIWQKPKINLDPDMLDEDEMSQAIEEVNDRIEELQDQQMEHLWLNMNEEGTLGQIQGWIIEGNDGRGLTDQEVGHLVDTEWYVFLHIFSHHGSDQVTIYYWIGAKSSNNKELIAANLVVDLDESLENKGSHCRVVMNNESVHFLALFKNGLVIHSGNEQISQNTVHLYCLLGSTPYNSYVVQVEAKAANLNTGLCFALVSPESVYLWRGNGAHENEFEQAQRLMEVLLPGGSETVEIREGQEQDDFWTILGGKAEYSLHKALASAAREARLFQLVYNISGLIVNELRNFSQDDLFEDDLMILDTYDEIYVWLGQRCNAEEKSKAVETAVDYLEAGCDGRSGDVCIIVVNSGCEPPMFIRHFVYWDYNRSSEKMQPFMELLNTLIMSSEQQAGMQFDFEEYYATVLKKEEEEMAEENERAIDIKQKGKLMNEKKFEKETVTLTAAQMRERDKLGSAQIEYDLKTNNANWDKEYERAQLPEFQLRKGKHYLDQQNNESSDANMSRAMRELEAKRRLQMMEERNRKYYSDPEFLKVPLNEIIASCPSAVDPSRKEAYLTDDDFQRALGMNKEAFYALKEWKRKDLKKRAKIF